MRLVSLQVEGFRAFSGKQDINLDADCLLLFGPNGTGKTSILDAILWALCGTVPRLRTHNKDVISRYAPAGVANVSLTIRKDGDSEYTIRRQYDGSTCKTQLEQSGDILTGRLAENRILEVVWPTALLAEDSFEALAHHLTRSVYLQQDTVRQFLESDTDTERFEVASEFVGIGRVTELQSQIESARNAWSRVITHQQQDLKEGTAEIGKLEASLGRLGRESPDELKSLSNAWNNWWKTAYSAGLPSGELPAVGSNDAPPALNGALKQLTAIQATKQRKMLSVTSAKMEIEALSSVDFKKQKELIGTLAERVHVHTKNLETLHKQVLQAQTAAAEERQRLTQQKEHSEELKALASLALRHLGPLCPVCQQEYDRTRTEKHLENLEKGTHEVTGSKPEEAIPVSQASEAVVAEERKRAETKSELDVLESKQNEARSRQKALQAELADLGVSSDSDKISQVVTEVHQRMTQQIDDLRDLQFKGEDLSLRLARASEHAQRGELQAALSAARKRVAQQESTSSSYIQTREVASRIIDSLRDAAIDVVTRRIQGVEPLANRIYARLDPHPAFTATRLLAHFYNRKGRLDAFVEDPQQNITSQNPHTILSSSQMNALAVSLFLAFGLSFDDAPLSSIILDDPFQSLDDINLLGLVDTLKRVRTRRQLILSTHDLRFAGLLRRKLRPVTESNVTRVIKLEAWSREGPNITQTEDSSAQPLLRVLTRGA